MDTPKERKYDPNGCEKTISEKSEGNNPRTRRKNSRSGKNPKKPSQKGPTIQKQIQRGLGRDAQHVHSIIRRESSIDFQNQLLKKIKEESLELKCLLKLLHKKVDHLSTEVELIRSIIFSVGPDDD